MMSLVTQTEPSRKFWFSVDGFSKYSTTVKVMLELLVSKLLSFSRSRAGIVANIPVGRF